MNKLLNTFVIFVNYYYLFDSMVINSLFIEFLKTILNN